MTIKGAKRRAQRKAKILLINIHEIRYISYSIAEQLADCANKKSYSALLNSLDRLALALRAVFLGSWARFPRVNNIALILILLQQNYWEATAHLAAPLPPPMVSTIELLHIQW